jgi:hypothetical protein
LSLGGAAAPPLLLWLAKKWVEDTSHDKERVSALKSISDGLGKVLKFFGDDAEARYDAQRRKNRGDWRQGEAPSAPTSTTPMNAAAPASAGASSATSETASSVISSLVAKGWTREQAAGIAANFKAESNFNPGAVGDNGRAYGIGHWHPDRQAVFKELFGKDIRGSTLEEQLAFAHYELTQGSEKRAGDLLRKTQNAGQAGAVISQYYERPADRFGQANARAQLAWELAMGPQPNAAQMQAQLQGLPQPGAAMSMGAMGYTSALAGNNTTNNTEINIKEVNVQTASADAKGIFRDMRSAIRNNRLVNQANQGLA